MIGESMFYLEEEIIYYGMSEDGEKKEVEKKPVEEEAKAEEAVEESPVEEETKAEEAVEESPVEEEAKAEEAVEEAPAEEEAKAEEAVEESPADEEAKAKEAVEEAPADEEVPLDPKEVEYVANQTNLFQATYVDMQKNIPQFRSGDKVSVGYRVIEGERSRIQSFDGIVIKISSGHGMDKTFTVRKVSNGIGVERIFPFHSPNIDYIKDLKQGKVRRAKLYYLRDRVGKATRIKERNS